MLIPKARGSLSAALFAALPSLEPDDALPTFASTADDEADEQIALWALYELHYRGFEDADVALEWHPDLLRLRRVPRASPSSNAFRTATPMRPSRHPDRRSPTRSSPSSTGTAGRRWRLRATRRRP